MNVKGKTTKKEKRKIRDHVGFMTKEDYKEERTPDQFQRQLC